MLNKDKTRKHKFKTLILEKPLKPMLHKTQKQNSKWITKVMLLPIIMFKLLSLMKVKDLFSCNSLNLAIEF